MKTLTVIDPTKIRVIIGVAQLSSGTMVSCSVIVTRVGLLFTPKLNAPHERFRHTLNDGCKSEK